MSENQLYSVTDTRTICKYGAKCYQKNPEHHKTYKHPIQVPIVNRAKKRKHLFEPYNTDKKDKDSTIKSTKELCKDKTDFQSSMEDKKSDSLIVKGTSCTNYGENETDIISPSDIHNYFNKETDNSIYQECFQVQMPDDFFKFYECLNEESSSVEHLMASVNLEMIGPFDLLLGKLPKLDNKELYLIHWRFFYDVPEFQAVLKKKGKSELHIGYFRDDPNEKPVFLGVNDSAKDYIITPIAENIFGAVYWFLQNEKQTSPFLSVACQKLSEKVRKWATNCGYTIEDYDKKIRNKQVVCKSFHGAGIVVPYNKKTQLGYRKLVESDGSIKKMFKNFKEAKTEAERNKILSDIQPLITYSSIAVDECDFGTGLEAGIALFCSGIKEFHNSALTLLSSAYSLLKRDEFGTIIQTHLQKRRKGPHMALWGEQVLPTVCLK